jgi:SAM-dependent methyltransferase
MLKYNNCRCCGGTELTHWLALPHSPVANALFSQPDYERHPLELNTCPTCGHMQLASAPEPNNVFSTYKYKSGVSASLRRHFDEYADTIYKEYGEGASKALEIGSNDGYLLERFKQHGLDVVGVEPSEYLKAEHDAKGIPVLTDFFNTDLVNKQGWTGSFDFVFANNVMAHIPDTLDVVHGIANALKDNGIFVAECGAQEGITSGKYIDNVYHEHIDYYTPYSFSVLLERAGLKVLKYTQVNTHGVSFRIIAQKAAGKSAVEFSAVDFAAKRKEVEKYISDREDRMKALLNDREFIAYGAAAKAVTSLYTLLMVNDKLVGVVDDNELKQGYYFPGTGILITSPEELDKDALVVITAWNVYKDIKAKLESRGHRGEILCMQ